MSGRLFTAAAFLAASALAAPTEPNQPIYTPAPAPRYYFTASVSVENGNILESLPLNPNTGIIAAGKPVNVACPASQPINSPGCPPTNPEGVYYLNGTSLLLGTSEFVTQNVYVNPADGVLRFNDVSTPIPNDVYTDGFSRNEDGVLSYGTYPIWACQDGAQGEFNIIIQFPGVEINSYFCGGTPTGIATKAATGPGAFEYV